MVVAKFEGYFGEDNGVNSWVKGEFVRGFPTFKDALKHAQYLQVATDKVVLSVTNTETNETILF